MKTPDSTIHAGHGFSLLELLVALFVSAIGILGMLALQGRAQQAQLDVYQRAQAMLIVEEMTNRIASNMNAAACYQIASLDKDTAIPTVCPTTVHSDSEDIWEADMTAWKALLDGSSETVGGTNVGTLRDAIGCITQAAGVITVSVAWQGQIARPLAALPANGCGAVVGETGERRVMSVDLEFAG